MSLEPDILRPLERGDGRRTAVEVYETLQDSILTGRLKPGTVLSQVEVARVLHVSRTPVREAMRMLQEGGLVTGEPNFRSRVLGFDPRDIEALYMKRIMMESLAVTFTTRTMTAALKQRLDEVVHALEGQDAHASFTVWQGLHREFHRLIVAQAGDAYTADLEALEKRSERYQSAYKGEHLPGWWQRGEQEHRALFDAVSSGNAMLAGELSARHLARTALELLAALAPEYDTGRVRMSLQFAIAGAAAGRL
ncbi:GntR family transcriptional regulator [Sphingomonas oryzagri]|uniref:GntR family transcriptional regulator n=1 Tax=Sphingomonas oryzagri TaxID=3042314 RepID=A0ABT6N162_9SPHN|nr:GntR family transcriptional regulator [Sphingomonas oryzagri]MDH7639039.1 GntR family transcriptional regulator [Sphingomonas oryzagri]